MSGSSANICLHGIQSPYDDLSSYFLGFAWICDHQIPGWDDSAQRFSELGILPVPILHRGVFDAATVNAVLSDLDLTRQEGFVVRTSAPFAENAMATHMAKYVRADHVQGDTHWMHADIVKNGLQKG